MTTTTAPPCIDYQRGMWQVHKFGGTSVANAIAFDKSHKSFGALFQILLKMIQIHQQTVNWALSFRLPK
jgi:hypothetical protein